MKFYTHITASILFFVTFSFLINFDINILSIFIAGGVSVFPDIVDIIQGKHKGIGHSIFWLIPFFIIGFFNFGISVALVIGFLSHILMDIFTFKGCPFLYPFSKMDFISLNRRNRIQTGTTQEKAVFLFILFLLIPTLLLTNGLLSIGNMSINHNLEQAPVEVFGLPTNSLKSNINLNLQLNSNVSKNITIHHVNENETNIVVNDFKPGG